MTNENLSPQKQHELRKAIQTVRMTHRLLELGYRFDDSKAAQMLMQLRQSIELVEHRIFFRSQEANLQKP